MGNKKVLRIVYFKTFNGYTLLWGHDVALFCLTDKPLAFCAEVFKQIRSDAIKET